MQATKRNVNGLPGWVASVWWATGLSLCAVLLVYAMPNSPLRSRPAKGAATQTVAVSSTAADRSAAGMLAIPLQKTERQRVLRTRPIETIKVGQRVLGTNPKREEVAQDEEPDPKTWRKIDVELVKANGKKLYATLLRPRKLLEETIDPQTCTLGLFLPEMGAVGSARVLRMGPCPRIIRGQGHIVTATFKHQPDGDLVEIIVDGETIGCTANHPSWSEDRQEFVEASKLREGERVRTRLEGVSAVTSIKPRPPTDWVYNLEVQGEHVYEVSPGGLLVHNNCTHFAYVLFDDADNIVYIGKGGTPADFGKGLRAIVKRHSNRYAEPEMFEQLADGRFVPKWARGRVIATNLTEKESLTLETMLIHPYTKEILKSNSKGMKLVIDKATGLLNDSVGQIHQVRRWVDMGIISKNNVKDKLLYGWDIPKALWRRDLSFIPDIVQHAR